MRRGARFAEEVDVPVSKSLLQLREDCREVVDMEQSSFLDDAELTRRVNASAARMHTMLAAKLGGEYMRDQATRLTVAGQSYIELLTSLPAASAVYKLEGVDVDVGGNPRPLEGVVWKDLRDRRRSPATGRPTHYARSNFRAAMPRLELYPTPDTAYSITFFYVPNYVPLVADVDEFTLPEDWFEWIAYDVGIRMMIKEEGSMYRAMAAERERIEKLIDSVATDIDGEHALQWLDEEGLTSDSLDYTDESSWIR